MSLRPNLFIVGAMKSGSTSLHELLAGHPAICMSEPKEPCYFLEPGQLKKIWPEMWKMGFWEHEDAYLNLFARKPEAVYRGESSTDYSKLPEIIGIAEKMRAYSPGARIVYIMRDPVERTISHYWHMVENRGETRDLMTALVRDPHYTDVSNYAMQLEPYMRLFGVQNVYTMTFEALTANAETAVSTLLKWLWLDTAYTPPNPGDARNVTPNIVTQHRLGSQIIHRLLRSHFWEVVGGHVPAPIRKLGRSVIQKPVFRNQVDQEAAKKMLRELQRPQVEILSRMTGDEYSEWKTLYGA